MIDQNLKLIADDIQRALARAERELDIKSLAIEDIRYARIQLDYLMSKIKPHLKPQTDEN